jgi:hypothetical protein
MYAGALGVPALAIYFEVKSNTNVIVFSLLTSLFTVVAPLVLLLEFIPGKALRNYSMT